MRLCTTFLFAPILAILFLATPSDAKLFRNAYVSFEVPEKWECRLEDTEWVCRSTFVDQAKEAIIILTAKEVGPADSLPSYEMHLKAPKTIASRSGAPVTSTVFQVKQRKIGNHPWVDGMHLSSEVPDYYTRYLATVKDRIAILVTFSAHKLQYTRYSQDFFRAIESLRVVAEKDLIKNPGSAPLRPGHETLGAPIADHMSDMYGELPDEDQGGRSTTRQMFMAGAFLLAVIGLYLFLKRKTKSNGK